jgi:hypothetical protein
LQPHQEGLDAADDKEYHGGSNVHQANFFVIDGHHPIPYAFPGTGLSLLFNGFGPVEGPQPERRVKKHDKHEGQQKRDDC